MNKKQIRNKFFAALPALSALPGKRALSALRAMSALRALCAAAALATLAALPGCVAEEWEYCPPRLLISTDHEVGLYGDPAGTRAQSRARIVSDWYDCIDTVSVYIFDENERFVALWKGGHYTPGREYEIPLQELCLPEGSYTFVAWTNLGSDHYANIDDATLTAADATPRFLDDMVMNLTLDNGAVTSDPAHRHFGILERVNLSNNSILTPRQSTIVLDPAIHKVNFMVEGIERDRIRPGSIRVNVIDGNPQHDFRNRFVRQGSGQTYTQTRTMEDVTGLPGGPGDWRGEGPVEVNPPAGIDPTNGLTLYTSSMGLMQIHDLPMTGFEIRNEAETDVRKKTLFKYDNLVSLIQLVYAGNNQKVDFEETLEFDIVISLVSEGYVNLTINGWTYRLNLIPLG
jgi:hypothetical protein